jgi:hypothetical protein
VVVREFHEQHCEAHSLLPQHECLMAQAHPDEVASTRVHHLPEIACTISLQ